MKKILLFLFVFLVSCSSIFAYSNTNDFVSSWRLDNNSVDSYGINNGIYIGSYSNVSGIPYLINNYAYFTDGVSGNYINVSNNVNMNCSSAITIGGWVNSVKLGDQRVIMSKYATSTALRTFFFETENTGNKFHFRLSVDGTNTGDAYSNLSITNNTWYYVVVVWNSSIDNGYPHIYVNGTDNTNTSRSVNVTGNLFYSPLTSLRIGSYEPTPARNWNGTLDELWFACRSWSPSEVNQSYYDYLNGIRITDTQCDYTGSGDFIQNNTICNITQNVNIQAGYSWIIQNSTVYSNSTISGGNGWNWISGILHLLKW